MELTTLSAEVWRDALLSEDTEAFLSAARNYLGRIPTPYNKHALVARLEAFLKRPDTVDAQTALLDSLDARILGALALAGPCPERFLRELLSDEHSSWEVALRLANLRDRLILFRAPGPQGSVLAVTPALSERLSRETTPAALLGWAGEEGPVPAPAVNADTICAAAGVLFHEANPLRKDGRPIKRVRDRLLTLVPELSHASEGGDALDALLSGFRGAGFLSESGNPDMDRVSAAAGAWGERLPFLLAAASSGLGFRPDGTEGPLEPYARIAERARFLETVAALIPGGSRVSDAGIRRLALLAGRLRGAVGAAQADYAVEALLRFGLLIRKAGGVVRAFAPPRPALRSSPSRGAGPDPVLVVEASHVVQVLPEADSAARIFAATVSRLESRGEVWSCILDRKSVRRALDAGLDAAEIARSFERLSGRPLPQSLAFSLTGWEKEYLSVRLYSGLVLAADGPARTLAENAPGLAGLRAERVAEGAWLLSTEDFSEIQAALEKAGLHAPRVRRSSRRSAPRGVPTDAPERGGDLPVWADRLGAPEPRREYRPEELQERLRTALERLELPEERRAELAERISRRLILTEDQLARAETGGDSLEAGALDYMGKVRVVERVLRSSGAILEILFRRPDGEPERFRVRPLELEKKEKGLQLRAADTKDGNVRILPISAMSHVKRIKTTLFGEEHEYDT